MKLQWLTEDSCTQLIDQWKRIQREVVYARYPIELGGARVTPMEYYTEKKSRRIIDDAKFVVNEIKKYLKKQLHGGLSAEACSILATYMMKRCTYV